jgi:hypothetical protein
MKTGKLKKFETVKTSLIVADTDEERQCLIAELLLIAERMPVEKIVPKNVTKYNSGDAEKIIPKNVTKHNLSDAEKKIPKNLTVFNSEELRTLESLKDAEQ